MNQATAIVVGTHPHLGHRLVRLLSGPHEGSTWMLLATERAPSGEFSVRYHPDDQFVSLAGGVS